MVLATDALHLGWVCACSELTCALSFAIGVRSQGSFDAEVSGVSPSPASPRRGCLSVKHPARPASSSTSATKDWSFSAPYIRTKRRCCPSPRLSPQTVFPDDETAQALFSATQTTSTLFPEIDRRISWGGGRAARGVSPWSLFCCLRISVAGGAKKHQTAVIFCVSVASYLPARVQIAAPICAAGPVALLASGRCVSTSVISRLAPGVC